MRKNERTFFSLLDGPDHIVNERLEVPEGIRDVRRLIHLGKRGIEYGDDVLQEICGVSLAGQLLLSSDSGGGQSGLTSYIKEISCSLSLNLEYSFPSS